MRRKINIDGVEFTESLQNEIDNNIDDISEFAPSFSVFHLWIEPQQKYKYKFNVKMRLVGPSLVIIAESDGKNLVSVINETKKKMVKQMLAIKDKNIHKRRREKAKNKEAA